MHPFEIKSASSDDNGKLTCETYQNATNNLGHEISLMDTFPPNRKGHRRAHSDITILHDNTISDITAPDDSSGDDGIQSEPISLDESDDDLFPIPFSKQQRQSSTSVAIDLNSNEGVGVIRQASAPSLENKDQRKQSGDVDHLEHDISNISPSNNTYRVIPFVETRRFVSAEKLAEIALVDPRRARRILSNRQSAARSKQRKVQYRVELEEKVNMLKGEAASLNAHLTALQREMEALDAENLELKLKSQTVEQQVQLQEALNDAIRKEIEYLKILTRDIIPTCEVVAQLSSFRTRQGQQFHTNHNHDGNNLLLIQQLHQNHITSQLEEYQPQQNWLGCQLSSKMGNGASSSSTFKK